MFTQLCLVERLPCRVIPELWIILVSIEIWIVPRISTAMAGVITVEQQLSSGMGHGGFDGNIKCQIRKITIPSLCCRMPRGCHSNYNSYRKDHLRFLKIVSNLLRILKINLLQRLIFGRILLTIQELEQILVRLGIDVKKIKKTNRYVYVYMNI